MVGPTGRLELTDERLAADDVGGDLIALLSLAAWSYIRRAGLGHALLVVAETTGLDGVKRLTMQIDCVQRIAAKEHSLASFKTP